MPRFRHPGLFRISGDANQVKDLKQQFDYGEGEVDLTKVDIHSVAGLIKSYLRELPTPLLTYELYAPLTTCARNEVQRQQQRLASPFSSAHRKSARLRRADAVGSQPGHGAPALAERRDLQLPGRLPRARCFVSGACRMTRAAFTRRRRVCLRNLHSDVGCQQDVRGQPRHRIRAQHPPRGSGDVRRCRERHSGTPTAQAWGSCLTDCCAQLVITVLRHLINEESKRLKQLAATETKPAPPTTVQPAPKVRSLKQRGAGQRGAGQRSAHPRCVQPTGAATDLPPPWVEYPDPKVTPSARARLLATRAGLRVHAPVSADGPAFLLQPRDQADAVGAACPGDSPAATHPLRVLHPQVRRARCAAAAAASPRSPQAAHSDRAC